MFQANPPAVKIHRQMTGVIAQSVSNCAETFLQFIIIIIIINSWINMFWINLLTWI